MEFSNTSFRVKERNVSVLFQIGWQVLAVASRGS